MTANLDDLGLTHDRIPASFFVQFFSMMILEIALVAGIIAAVAL